MDNDLAMKRASFLESAKRAKKLIQMDARGELDKIANNVRSKITFNDDGDLCENNVTYTSIPQDDTSFSQHQISHSHLPKSVLESITTNPIDTSVLGASVGQASILDALKITPEQTQVSRNVNTAPVITEERKQTSLTEEYKPNIDYSLVKTIVEDCVKRYTSALKKSLINENKSLIGEDSTLKAMKIGNKFTFIASNGDLYEATLKKVGNINKK